MISLKEYFTLLKKHDWYYEYSDDNRVYLKGEDEIKQLKTIARTSPEFQDLFTKFHEHYFSGEDFGTKKTLLPEEPKE